MFAKLLAINSPVFDFDACDFSEKGMKSKDKFCRRILCSLSISFFHRVVKVLSFVFLFCSLVCACLSRIFGRDGESKEGAGRVAVYRLTGVTHCYTLECNYNYGSRDHPVHQIEVHR